MRVRFITTCALGLAAALTLDASSLTAQSQDTTKLRRTTSSQRIPISKESPGEVITVRVDTVFVTRHDTVTNTILRIDTVTVTPPPPPPRIKEWYWGLFAGAAFPTGDLDRLYTNGYNLGGVIGWDAPDSWYGFRLDGGVSQVGRERLFFFDNVNGTVVNPLNLNLALTDFNFGTGTPLIWSMGLNAKARYPSGGWSPYVTVGVNWNATDRIALRSRDDVLFDNVNGVNTNFRCDRNDDFLFNNSCFRAVGDRNWRNTWGWNWGLGSDFHIGSQDMFIEGRWIGIVRDNHTSSYVPVTLGVRFF